MKILFVSAPSQDSSDRFFGWPTSLLYAIAPTIDAIKKGCLNADYVKKIFEPIWYVEGENSQKTKKSFYTVLKKEQVNVVCISSTYDSFYPAMELMKLAKKYDSNIITILGGAYSDETHDTKLNSHKLFPNIIDFEIAGDGEFALLEILRFLSKSKNLEFSQKYIAKKINGIVNIYHKYKKYVGNGKRLNLNELPFMPIELVNIKWHKNDFDIFSENKTILPTIQMVAQRGCTYSCNFCSESKLFTYKNPRSIKNILEEIELRKSQGFKAIFFDDSTFGTYSNKNQTVSNLLAAFKKTNMTFGSLNRFNHLNSKTIIDKYKNANFDYLYCSIEQFDINSLTKMNKLQTKEQMIQSIKLLKNANIRLGVSLLYGLPYETKKSIENTLNFTQKCVNTETIVMVSESLLSYHPGIMAKQNIILDFNRQPPNFGYPHNRFEEGQWYHPKKVTTKYCENILKLSENKFSDVLARNRHSWYQRKGLITED